MDWDRGSAAALSWMIIHSRGQDRLHTVGAEERRILYSCSESFFCSLADLWAPAVYQQPWGLKKSLSLTACFPTHRSQRWWEERDEHRGRENDQSLRSESVRRNVKSQPSRVGSEAARRLTHTHARCYSWVRILGSPLLVICDYLHGVSLPKLGRFKIAFKWKSVLIYGARELSTQWFSDWLGDGIQSLNSTSSSNKRRWEIATSNLRKKHGDKETGKKQFLLLTWNISSVINRHVWIKWKGFYHYNAAYISDIILPVCNIANQPCCFSLQTQSCCSIVWVAKLTMSSPIAAVQLLREWPDIIQNDKKKKKRK